MKKLLILLCVVALAGLHVGAKTDLAKYHQEIMELSIDENLQSPIIPPKLMAKAHDSMATLAARFGRANLKTDLTEREGTVLMVTVPVSDLFNANDTLLSKIAQNKLKVLAQPLRISDKYKVLIVVHSDDTGTEEYRNNLTRLRADAIRSWIAGEGISVDAVIPYGIGYDEPINSEVSRKGRAANRRVEFYYVPGPMLIEELKSRK